MTKKGIGKSNNENPFQAGLEAAKKALENAKTESCDLVIVYSTDGYENYDELLKGVRKETKEAPLVGSLAGGIVDNEGPDEKLKTVAVIVIKSDKIKFTSVMAENLKENSEGAGESVANQLSENWDEEAKFLLLFPGGLSVNPNALFRGLEKNLPQKIPFLGGSSGGTTEFKKTHQFFNDKVLDDAVVAVLFSGEFDFEVGVSHGALSSDISSIITKAEGNVIHEFNNQPAFEIYSGFAKVHEDVLLRTMICLGSKIPLDKDNVHDENFVLRIPLAILENNSLVMSAEWPEGKEIFLCERDVERMKMKSKESAERIQRTIKEKGGKAEMVLQFECLGRAKGVLGEGHSQDIIKAYQDAFDPDIPWLGWYTYGEIAPAGGKNEFHNWTGVLLVIY